MLHNPAKTAYMRFDAIAKDDDKEQEPLEIAKDYFIAIRQQREKLKQEDK